MQLVVLLDGKAVTDYTMHNSVLKTTCALLHILALLTIALLLPQACTSQGRADLGSTGCCLKTKHTQPSDNALYIYWHAKQLCLLGADAKQPVAMTG